MGGFLSVEQDQPQSESAPSQEPLLNIPSSNSMDASVSGQVPGEMDDAVLAERRALEEMKLKEQQESEHVLGENKDTDATAVAAANAVASDQGAAASVVAEPVKDEVEIEVSKILEDGMKDYFKDLDEVSQQRFKAKGDEVAHQLSTMVRGFKVNVKKVLVLLRDWLLTIPRVNKFFLEQEAKIKTDKILEYEQFYHEKKNNAPG